jgi:hypothetical protein
MFFVEISELRTFLNKERENDSEKETKEELDNNKPRRTRNLK